MIKLLTYLRRVANDEVSTLASKYLPLFKECKDRYDSCLYEEAFGISDCLCPFNYIILGRPLELKKIGCQEFSGLEIHKANLGNVAKEFHEDMPKLLSYLKQDEMSNRYSMNRLDAAKPTSRIEPLKFYNVCTCAEDNCNSNGLNTSTLAPKGSIQCYVSQDDEITNEVKNCSDVTEEWTEMLEYIEKRGDRYHSKLASKYLKLVKECPEKFESCSYEEFSGLFGCHGFLLGGRRRFLKVRCSFS